ncbi:MAG: SMC family ATPase [Desulfurococcales archaeon]|nr:SMC family ATPase [Desulfurococcales archaeon]
MTYIIRSVEVKGFLGYASEARLSLGPGTYALVGENGAGKSSIVDAIRAALVLPRGLKVRGDAEVVNHSSPRATVAVVLEDSVSGERLEVKVEKSRGRTPSILVVHEGPQGKRRATKQDDAKKLIAEALGLPSGDTGILENAAILKQGGLDEIISKLGSTQKKEGREFIEKVLGIKDYAKAVNKLKEVSPEDEPELTLNKSAPNRIRNSLSKARRDLEETRKKLAAKRRELEEVTKQLEKARARLAEVEGSSERLAALEAEAEGLRARLDEIRARLRDRRARAAEEERLASRLGELEAEAERLEALARLAEEALGSYEALKARLEALEAEAQHLKEELESLAELEALRGDVEELSRAREELEALRRAREEKARRLEALRERLAGLRSQAERLSRAAGRLAKALGIEAPEEPRGVLDEARRRIGELNGEIKRLEEEAERLLREAEAARASARDLEERARKLRGAQGQCPLCGSPLPPEKARSIAESYEEEARKLRARASRLDSKAARLRARIEALRREAEGLARLAARLEEALNAAPSPEEVRGLEEEAGGLEGELEGLEARIRDLEGLVERLGGAERRYNMLLGRIKSVSPEDPHARKGLEALLGERTRELEEAREALRDLEARLTRETGAPSPREALGILRGASRRLRVILGELERARRARERLAELEEEIRGLEEEARKAEARLGELEAEAERLRARAEEERRLRRRLEELLSRAGRLEGEVRSLEAEAEKLEQEVGRLEALYRKALRARRLLEILEEAPPRILRVQLSMLSRLMSEVLSAFNLGIVSASFTLDPEGVGLVLTRTDGRQATLQELSGGERVAVALSFIVALSRLHAIRAGFLVLDEPTAHLDADRKRRLVQVLRSVTGGGTGIPQLVIVTHDEEVARAADEVCRVWRSGGSSRLSCGGGEG